MNVREKAVVIVIGKDMVGILSKVSGEIAKAEGSVLEVSQNVLDGYFTMTMIINIDGLTCEIHQLQNYISEAVPGMTVHVMHEDIFNSMHRI